MALTTKKKTLKNLSLRPIVVFLILICSSILLKGQTIYVSPQGDDKNPGTKLHPLATAYAAQMLSRKIPSHVSASVVFLDGTYYMPGKLIFTSEDSKTNGASLTFSAENEGKAILSGGSLLRSDWENYGKGIFVTNVPDNTIIDQLYINGIRQRMARFPNAVNGKNVFDTWDLNHGIKNDSLTDPLTSERIARWKNPQGGYIHAMHSSLWGDMHWIIKGKDSHQRLDYEGGWQNNRPSQMHPVYRIVENIFEELDNPGEWYFNAKEHKLYYMPDAETNLKNAKIEIVRLRELIEFNGTKNNPVKNIHLQGFIFRQSARTFMDNREPLLRSDWTVCRSGAVFYNGAEDCKITDCEFDQVGGNTIFANNYNRRITITGCYIHGSGANGIVFVGDPASVRSPIFQYGPQDYQHVDHGPGPLGDNFPEDCLVEDCVITRTGRDEKQTAPIHISMSHKIRVNHCSIYDVPRAGININEGTFGGHIIENCDVFNTVLETGDHGSFNSWGRDRYWTPDVKQTVMEVQKDPSLPFLDMVEPNIIRNSRWRCDHGWDIDLDDGSSQYLIQNNLLLNGGLKMREGYHRTATNNIIVNNGLHPHVWYTDSGDIFSNNIVFLPYQPAIMDATIAKNGKWGKELDHNFYASPIEFMTRFAVNGCDLSSLNGDPQLIDPAKGDFRVSSTSPALKTGFKNFPMNDFGVLKPSLRRIAKIPAFPLIEIKSDSGPARKVIYKWMDIELQEPSAEQKSAFGIGFNENGVALSFVPENSEAARKGFHTGDFILQVNGIKIKSIQNLITFIHGNKNSSKKHTFVIIRNQSEISISMVQPLSEIISVN